MYGFHKVPHLQSGVLKNESPSELWEFVNPFFKRDQPQLLARVTRKNNRPAAAAATTPPTPSSGATGTRSSARQAAANAQITGNPGYPGVHLLTDGTVEGEAGPLVGPVGQLADLHAIQSGINAIRQTQAAIGADLKALQASNEHLWREALESRERQQKHEETIDLIVSFLERLFGTEGEGLKGLKEAMRRGGMGTRNREESATEEPSSKKRRRLLIEGGEEYDPATGRLVEIQGDYWRNGAKCGRYTEPDSDLVAEPETYQSTNGSSRSSVEPWASNSHRFQALPTDEEGSPLSHSRSTSSASTAMGVKPGYAPTQDQTLHQGGISPLSDTVDLRTTTDDTNTVGHYNNSNDPSKTTVGSHLPNNMDQSGLNLDPSLLQTTIGSILQSPAAAQMFLNSLNSSAQAQTLTAPAKGVVAPSPSSDNTDPTPALFSPLPQMNQGLVNNANDLLGAYHKAAGVGDDVDKLQESIDSLVRSMGLDLPQGHPLDQGHHMPSMPTSMPQGQTNQAPLAPPPVPSSGNQNIGNQQHLGNPTLVGPDDSAFENEFNVDDFLAQLPNDGNTPS